MADRNLSSFARVVLGVRKGHANRRAVVGVVLFVVFSAGYGFWDGYHHGRSIVDAIVSAVAALVAVAITGYLLERREI
jgi:hypothetical protein